MKDPKGKAYPAELKDKYKLCPECNNKDEKGHPVLGHGKGSLQCWKVRKGLLKAHPMFKKHASTYPNLKLYDPFKKGASQGRPALIYLVDSSDACCPILMVNDDDANQDTGPQTRLPPPGYGQNQLAIPQTLPVSQPHQVLDIFDSANSLPLRSSQALVPAVMPMYDIGSMNMADHYPFINHGLQLVFVTGDIELIAFAFPAPQQLDPNSISDSNYFLNSGKNAVASCGNCRTDALVFDSRDKPESREPTAFPGQSCLFAHCQTCQAVDRFSMDTDTYGINRIASGRATGNFPHIGASNSTTNSFRSYL